VKWAINHATSKNLQYIRMDTVGENQGLIDHYRKHGFSFLGLSKLENTTNRRNPKYAVVKLRATTKKFRTRVLAMKAWIRRARSLKLPELLGTLRRKLQGCWNYYAARCNSSMTATYSREVIFLLFNWLNRRSQPRSFTWSQFLQRLLSWKLAPPRIAMPSPQLRLPWPATPA